MGSRRASIAGLSGQFRKVIDPGRCRAAPDLAGRPEPAALADAAPANAPIVRAALAAREQRRAAAAAEVLVAHAAIVAGLRIDFQRLSRDPDLIGGTDRRDAI